MFHTCVLNGVDLVPLTCEGTSRNDEVKSEYSMLRGSTLVEVVVSNPNISEYGQEMPQSHTANHHTAPRGRDTNSHMTARRQLK